MDKLQLNEKDTLTNQEKEVYRTLRTNIEFTGIENKVIAITSCMPDDGKTTISYNLACAFARNDKKTLFIDADLRKSIFVQRYGIEGNPKGLTHYLAGHVPFTEIVYKTNIDSLYVIPVGTFPSNPTELFAKDRFSKMLEELKKVFDYIIVDTPPLGSVIDAAVIAQKCDASMLVVSSNTTSRTFAKSVITQLKTANPNFLGIILNKVDVKRSGYYGKRYGSYYKNKYYSYYGYEDEDEE